MNRETANAEPEPLGDLPARALEKLTLVRRWRARCQADPGTTRLAHAVAVVWQAKRAGVRRVSVSALRHWARLLDQGGPPALCDRYTNGRTRRPSSEPVT